MYEDETRIKCPFCGEDGYDKVGLKRHLAKLKCKKYNEVSIDYRGFPSCPNYNERPPD